MKEIKVLKKLLSLKERRTDPFLLIWSFMTSYPSFTADEDDDKRTKGEYGFQEAN